MNDVPPRYRILSSLGKGGMGEVFLADDTQLGRQVAIKFLTEELAEDATARERLLREARSAAALDHPFICQVHEIAEIDGRTGIVMEHVSGETLEAVHSRSQLDIRRAVELASEVAEALEAAHKRRFVHRDLKPANVMLTDDGHVKVMDFGLAKPVEGEGQPSDGSTTAVSLTGSGVRVGTPAYMAPEQLTGGTVDARSDIFAFGILLYELLSGVHPFRRSSPSGTMAAILREAPAPVSQYAATAPVSARVALDRLLAKDPHRRYQTFAEVRADLAQVLQDSSGQAPLAVETASTSASGRTAFVGRETERSEGLRSLERAIGGQGGVLLVGGEPGVGKTRLAEELLVEGRQRGCLALTGRCYETEGNPPFMPWVEMVERAARVMPRAAFRDALGEAAPEVAKLVPELRQRFPEISPPIDLPPEQQRHYLFSNFLSFVERSARVTPQVWLIDDLHWADDSTLLLLQHVAQHVAQMPMLIIGTYRDVDLDVHRPFAEMLEALTRQRLAQKLALGRLSERVVSELLEALSGQAPPSPVVAVVYAETEGNPFFTEEVFRHLSEAGQLFDDDGTWRTDLRVDELRVPEGVRLVIGRRVKRLGDEARRVLTTAAIVGRSFDLELLDALGDAEGESLLGALEEAEAARLILSVSSGRDVRWEFAHGLIRQTLEHGLSLMRRQRAHLRVAEAMERVHGGNVDRYASDVGRHLYAAGAAADPEKTVRFLTLAGEQALAAGAFEEALRQFDDALSMHEEQDPRHTADLRYRKGQALRSLGRGVDAVEEWQAALTACERLGDGDGIARVAYDAAWSASWLGDMRGAQALARRGLESVGDGDPVTRCRLLMVLLMACSAAGDDYQASLDLLTEAEGLAETLDHPKLTAELHQAPLRFHYSYMQLPEAVEVGRRAVAERRERGELYDVCEVYWGLMVSLWYGGRVREALDVSREAETLSARVGHVFTLWVAHAIQTFHCFVTTGDLAESAARARRNIEDAERANNAFGIISRHQLGQVHFAAGDWIAARTELDTAARLNFEHFVDGLHASAPVLISAYAGEPGALEALQALRSDLLQLPEENPYRVWEQALIAVEGLALLDRRPDAAALYPLALKGVHKGAGISMQARLWQMVAGIAAACGEHWDAAQEHFENALREASELPHLIGGPETRRWYARMLLDRDEPGDRDKARTLLGEAIDTYREIGMPKHVEMAERMLDGIA